eukprot:CAMPEP_0197466086 /NCGR_PEP_ID=MMETSP1175-20131217/64869_1 /TAXON_ID=1003142 /ORGANISM="Triceratium dubium, Strain CCMP147" /LENGTH=1237 /DNA_ID=CAMNT_0043002115 /DNA_START=211 /DNA_END=3924 /DNA_ORIENTATION=-
MSTDPTYHGATASTAQVSSPTSPDEDIDAEKKKYCEKWHDLVEECDPLWHETDPGRRIAHWDDDGKAFIFQESEGFKKKLKEHHITTKDISCIDFSSIRRNMHSYGFTVKKLKNSSVFRASRDLFARNASRELLRQIKRNVHIPSEEPLVETKVEPAVSNPVSREEFDTLKKQLAETQGIMIELLSTIVQSSWGPNLAFANGQGNGSRMVRMEPSIEGPHGVDNNRFLQTLPVSGRVVTGHSTCSTAGEEHTACSGIAGKKQPYQDNMDESLNSTSSAEKKCDNLERGPLDDLLEQIDISDAANIYQVEEFDVVCIEKTGNILCYEDFKRPEGTCYTGNIEYDKNIILRRSCYSISPEATRTVLVNDILQCVRARNGRFLKTQDHFWYENIQDNSMPAIEEMTRRSLEKRPYENDERESNLNSGRHGNDKGGPSPDDGDGDYSHQNSGNSGPGMGGSTGRSPMEWQGSGFSGSSHIRHSRYDSNDAVHSLGFSAAKGTQNKDDENSDYPPSDEARPSVAFPLATALPCRRIDHARIYQTNSSGEDTEIHCSIAVVSASAVPKVLRGMNTDDGSHISTHSQGTRHEERAYALVKKLSSAMFGDVWVAVGAHQLSSRNDPKTESGSSTEWKCRREYFAVKRVPMTNFDLMDHWTAEDPVREVQAMQYFRRWYENNFHKEQGRKVETPYEEAVGIMAMTNVIIPVDVLTDDSYLYIITPYCSGGDLFDALFNSKNKARMGEEASRMFMNQALNGLEHLQKAGLAHRDISMENILCHNGSYIIADMGQCVRVPSKEQRRCLIDYSDGALVGKSHYRPPEVWANENFDGFAMDLWCLSITLFIALTGTYPGDSVLDERFWKGCADRESLEFGSGEWKELEETLMMHLADGAIDLLHKCLRRDPRRRLSLQQIRDHPWMARGVKTTNSPSAPNYSLRSAASVGQETALEKAAPHTDRSLNGQSMFTHKRSLSSEDAEAKLDMARKRAGDAEKLAADSKVSSNNDNYFEADSVMSSSYSKKSEAFGQEGANAEVLPTEVKAQFFGTEKALEAGKSMTDKSMALRRNSFDGMDLKDRLEKNEEKKEEIRATIEAMKTHLQEERVQQQACAALYSLAVDAENRVAVREAGGIPAIVWAMDAHPQAEDLQKHACAALVHLGGENINELMAVREAGGIPAIVRAMKVHPKVEEVQKHACIALYFLADNEENKRMICDAGGVRQLKMAEKNHAFSVKIYADMALDKLEG